MAAPVLLDYEYQYKDDGVKLNGSPTLPFIDVELVTGLDMAEIEVYESDVDGSHGGTVSAEFFKARTIVIDCTIYADPASVDSFLDTLYANYLPTKEAYPFYFKGSGIGTRLLYCKSLGIKTDTGTLRRVGSCKAQIQLKAADPIKYVETVTALTAGTYFTANNVGNMATYPVFRIQGGTQTSTVLRNNTTSKQITITRNMLVGDIIDVDFNTRSVRVNGVRQTSLLGTGVVDWWNLRAGTNSVRFSTTGDTGYTVPTGTLTWRSGWA